MVDAFGVIARARRELSPQSVVAYVISMTHGVSDVLDCEFVVLHALLFDLIVWHPYRPLAHFLASFTAHPLHAELTQRAWELANESLYGDAALLHPPHVVAVACLYMAAHMLGVDYRAWLRTLATPQTAIADCAHMLLQHMDRREAMERERGAEGGGEVVVDVLGAVLDGRLREAVLKLQEHHGTGKLGALGELKEEESKSDDKVAADDASTVDAVVILDDEQDCGLDHKSEMVSDDTQSAANKKQKIDKG